MPVFPTLTVFLALIAAARTLAELMRDLRLKAGLAPRARVGPYGRFDQRRHRSRAPWRALFAPARCRRIYAHHLAALTPANPAAGPSVSPAKLREKRA